MPDEIAIKVGEVSKNFVLPHEKVTSIKSAFTGMLRRKHTREVQHALKDINFEVKKGEFFGIVGRNGSGKSTLLKILAGIYQPNQGEVKTYGKLVPFIELGVGFNPELTGRENVYLNGALLGFSEKEIDAMYEDIVDFAELRRFMDQKLKNYSSGMQVRLAFSMAVRADADILLVDEVLAVGDADFQRKCFTYFKELKAKKKTVVFVTHDMNAVREYCDRAMLIEQNKMKLIGAPEAVSKEYSLLFIENDASNQAPGAITERWGNGAVRIADSKAYVKGEYIYIDVKVEAHKDIDGLMYGLHIIGEDGVEIAAVNNRMIQKTDIKQVRKGARITLAWKVLNIFNDGKYAIDLALVDDLNDVLDWVKGAAHFTIRRPERSTTSVLPPIEVDIRVN